jgi:hypothetical protein
LAEPVNLLRTPDLPDGLIFRILVKLPSEKYFAFTEIKIGLYAAPSRALEGRF